MSFSGCEAGIRIPRRHVGANDQAVRSNGAPPGDHVPFTSVAVSPVAAAQEIVAPPVGPGLEQRLRTKLADWRGLLRRNVDCGREVLRALLVVPLRFTPITEGRRRAYKFEGLVGLSRLVAGVIELPTLTGVASPTFASWNRVASWLRRVDALRNAA
jgi:hypothetical protein